MAAWVLVMLFFTIMMAGYSEGANYCVCRSDVSSDALQKALDYACGAGADCTPIHDGGVCFQPNTVRAHCSYATNSYYQRKGQPTGSCEFNGAATVTATDPSSNGCTYPASGSTAGTPTTGGTTTPTTPTTMPPPGSSTGNGGTGMGNGGTGLGGNGGTGFTPSSPTGIIGGGMGSGLGPSGNGMNTDDSEGLQMRSITNMLLLVTLWFSGLVFWWA
ncbi:hypothetical protein ACHQM5_006583 [Ranunculus cassubicifolius]